jgi:serine phosphatase RsbU (regulator of sigma subunit)
MYTNQITYTDGIDFDSVFSEEIELNIEFDLDKALDFVLRDLNEKYGFEGITIALLNRERDALINYKYLIKGGVISDEAIFELLNMRLPINSPDGGVAAYVMRTKTHVYAENINPAMIVTPLTKRIYELTKLKSNLIMPLEVYGQVLGLIGFPSYTRFLKLTEDEIAEIKNYVGYVSIAVSSSFFYNELKNQKKQLEHQAEIINKDINLARKVQSNFMPKKNPELSNINVSTRYIPMIDVGGDFFDFIVCQKENENNLGILITDASGHGVSAAFITSIVKMAFSSDKVFENRSNPGEVLKIINSMIIDKTADNFVTAMYCYFDFQNNKLKAACAGHNPMYLIRKKKITEVHPRGRILGFFNDIEFDVFETNIAKGDRFFLYTDGLSEATSIQGQDFEASLLKILKTSAKKCAEELNNIILDKLKTHVGNKEHYDDDIAIITLDLTG